MAHNYYIYILQCSDLAYYIGVTNDLDRRLEEHEKGLNAGCFTYVRRPVVLKYIESFDDIKEAIRREKQLKGWSRAKKEALMHQDLQQLRLLSRNTALKALDLPLDGLHPSTGSG